MLGMRPKVSKEPHFRSAILVPGKETGESLCRVAVSPPGGAWSWNQTQNRRTILLVRLSESAASYSPGHGCPPWGPRHQGRRTAWQSEGISKPYIAPYFLELVQLAFVPFAVQCPA